MRNRAYIGLGGNVGSVSETMGEALARLEAEEHTTVLAVSELYVSEPWGMVEQPQFYNAVALVDTSLRADDLLGLMKDIEVELGREEGAEPNSPRPIDMDVLLFGSEEWETPELVVPHPRMAERDFVITPLLELSPGATWPDGRPITRDSVKVGRVTGRSGRVAGYENRRLPDMGDAGTGIAGSPAESAERNGRRRAPFPGEEWVAVYEYGSDPQLFLGLAQGVTGAPAPLTGRQPDVRAYFAQVVLDQLGIPHEWDPFPPGQASDPYGFTRRFRLVVPSSMAPEALQAIEAAQDAPIDWSECDIGEPEDADDIEGPGDDEEVT